MLGLIGNLDFSELVIVVVAAILIFGKRLPKVAGQAGFYLARLRRAIETLWNETGVAREIRSVQRELQTTIPPNLSLGDMARRASADIQKQVDEAERVARAAHIDLVEESKPRPASDPAHPVVEPPGT